ncbi:MAG: NAD-dependent epimerase/dehydratase family protein [Fermentimonas sp.]|nr:NAD-dependent epimerase/dehydratase family protein [Fermentimonas sp.]
MKILVTGAAGFIGFHTVLALINAGYIVIGIDNICSYYDVQLKYARLKMIGIEENEIKQGEYIQSKTFESFRFIKMDLNDRERLNKLFEAEDFTYVVNLAAQAGVRYSLQNPFAYIDSNISGFMNLLEACRYHPVKHLVYASSSSVYGSSLATPFKETDSTDSPVSLYAATKKANELMAYSYAKLYNIHTTGIRFFTVYGPWGRPDMAPSLFMSAIIKGETIKLFNNGNMMRDFTFIDDVVNGVVKIIPSQSLMETPHAIYNIGCSAPVKLTDFLSVIEHETGIKAKVIMMDMQPGDVISTYADTTRLQRDFHYQPSTSLETGIHSFYSWFADYYKIPHQVS